MTVEGTRRRLRYVEAPTVWAANRQHAQDFYDGLPGDAAVFLAGGITGCPDWQSELVDHLLDQPITVLNPRRRDFPIGDPDAALAQIRWEHEHLRLASVISFWFCAATLCPIVLYELGAWSMTDKPLVVGVEPGYQREQDVRIQTALARPDVEVVDSLTALAAGIRAATS